MMNNIEMIDFKGKLSEYETYKMPFPKNWENIVDKVDEAFGEYFVCSSEEEEDWGYYNLKTLLYLYFILKVPEYFWTVPASSSGKYHPTFALGDGGLVRHTQMACEIAKEMFRLDKYGSCDPLHIMFALIVHDTFKSGHVDTGKTTYSHQSIAADELWDLHNRLSKDQLICMSDDVNCICSLVQTHMGSWSRTPPTTKEQFLVHLCDYIASRKYFDKFAIQQPYTNDVLNKIAEKWDSLSEDSKNAITLILGGSNADRES